MIVCGGYTANEISYSAVLHTSLIKGATLHHVLAENLCCFAKHKQDGCQRLTVNELSIWNQYFGDLIRHFDGWSYVSVIPHNLLVSLTHYVDWCCGALHCMCVLLHFFQYFQVLSLHRQSMLCQYLRNVHFAANLFRTNPAA